MKGIKKNSGFTLLEMLITFAVIAIVSGIFVSSFSSFRSAQDLSETQANIIGIINGARSRTLASDSNSNYGVHFETAGAVLFKGNVYSAPDPSNKIYTVPGSVEISSISLTGGTVDTVFTRLNGTTTASGTISIRSKRTGSTAVITLEPTGVVK